jgi:hypothetical protein
MARASQTPSPATWWAGRSMPHRPRHWSPTRSGWRSTTGSTKLVRAPGCGALDRMAAGGRATGPGSRLNLYPRLAGTAGGLRPAEEPPRESRRVSRPRYRALCGRCDAGCASDRAAVAARVSKWPESGSGTSQAPSAQVISQCDFSLRSTSVIRTHLAPMYQGAAVGLSDQSTRIFLGGTRNS